MRICWRNSKKKSHAMKATPANKRLLHDKCNIKETDMARPGESADQHRRALCSAFPGLCIRKAYFLQHDQRVAFSWGNLRQKSREACSGRERRTGKLACGRKGGRQGGGKRAGTLEATQHEQPKETKRLERFCVSPPPMDLWLPPKLHWHGLLSEAKEMSMNFQHIWTYFVCKFSSGTKLTRFLWGKKHTIKLILWYCQTFLLQYLSLFHFSYFDLL